jgi:hypothetical protein
MPDTDSVLHRVLFEKFSKELVDAALRIATTGSLRWEWVPNRGGADAQINTRARLRRRLGEGVVGLAAARRDERLALAYLLRWRPQQKAVISLTPLEFFEPGGREKVLEVDGVVVEPRQQGLHLTLLEAKRMRSGARAHAVRALEEKLGLVGFVPTARVSTVVGDRRGRLGWASATVRMR